MTDHYADGTCRWWHLSRPSPELLAALGDGWQLMAVVRDCFSTNSMSAD
jgi:hypothetical protein